ncbi:MAG: hypothetical protein ACK4VI_00475 [Alphaproteobacteria bacterium]
MVDIGCSAFRPSIRQIENEKLLYDLIKGMGVLLQIGAPHPFTSDIYKREIMTDIENITDQDKRLAKYALDSSSQAASTIQHIIGVSKGFTALVDELEDQIQALESGDASTLKRAMYGQIITLNKLFHDLCINAISKEHYGNGYVQHYMTLALKCQRQSMQTAALLSAYLPPPCIEAEGIEQNSANELLTMESDGDG